MSKADELWDKYADAERQVLFMNKADFLAALSEYGAMVRAEDVKICNSEATCEGIAQRCAAAIERMPLP